MDANTPPRTAAWQPLTFEGVAAFAYDSLSRLLLAQFVVGLSVAASVVCFFQLGWNPSIESAIDQLPEQGEIRDGKLRWPNAATQSLGEGSFVSFVVDPQNRGELGQSADVQFIFTEDELRVRSFLGYVAFPYPADRIIPLNHPALKPWWGAWQTAVTGFAALVLSGAVYLTWCLLALLYSAPVRVVAFYADRDLTWSSACKLTAAGLLSGALCMNIAILAYAFHRLNLLQLLAVGVMHIVVGWVFVFAAITRLPKLKQTTANSIRSKNPFAKPPNSRSKSDENSSND